MGMNLWSGCHTCREFIMHLRSEESLSIHPFYRSHYRCMKDNPPAVETLSDYYQNADAVFLGYKDVFEKYIDLPALNAATRDITAKKSLGGYTPTPVLDEITEQAAEQLKSTLTPAKSKPKED